jgi:hypothetical protein
VVGEYVNLELKSGRMEATPGQVQGLPWRPRGRLVLGAFMSRNAARNRRLQRRAQNAGTNAIQMPRPGKSGPERRSSGQAAGLWLSSRAETPRERAMWRRVAAGPAPRDACRGGSFWQSWASGWATVVPCELCGASWNASRPFAPSRQPFAASRPGLLDGMSATSRLRGSPATPRVPPPISSCDYQRTSIRHQRSPGAGQRQRRSYRVKSCCHNRLEELPYRPDVSDYHQPRAANVAIGHRVSQPRPLVPTARR